MIAACYSMDLYCRFDECLPTMIPEYRVASRSTFTGETWGDCKRQAQRDGWVFGRDGDVTCPTCATAKRKGPDGSLSNAVFASTRAAPPTPENGEGEK